VSSVEPVSPSWGGRMALAEPAGRRYAGQSAAATEHVQLGAGITRRLRALSKLTLHRRNPCSRRRDHRSAEWSFNQAFAAKRQRRSTGVVAKLEGAGHHLRGSHSAQLEDARITKASLDDAQLIRASFARDLRWVNLEGAGNVRSERPNGDPRRR